MTYGEQLPLFKCLPVPRGAQPWRRQSRLRKAAAAFAQWAQLEFRFILRRLTNNSDDEFDFPQQRVLTAAERPPPKTRAPASIFAFADRLAKGPRVRAPSYAASVPGALHAVSVERSGSVTRVVGAAFPSNRMTPEKEEAERARRARQRPPKPTRGAKTRGRKVREWDGEAMDT
jgi:hypothetical protein